MNITKKLAEELKIAESQVESVLHLLDEGNTIPFIARYRKEMTGSLDDATLRNLYERLDYLKGLEERRKTILSSIEEQGKLTDELKEKIEAAEKLSDLENLYRPYKKKKKTRASIAKEAGLSPLAEYLLKQEGSETSLLSYAKTFINPEKGVNDTESALQGAEDIIAEKVSDVASYYTISKDYINRTGKIESKETKNDVEGTYATYKQFSCPVRSVRNYQVLALNRGENEKKLQVSFDYDLYTIVNAISRDYLKRPSPFEERLKATFLDSYKRLIGPAVESEIRNDLFVRAEDAAIVIFKMNLKELLMASPLRGKRIMGFDPAFINGCKLAALDSSGKLLDVAVIYPTVGGEGRIEESKRVLLGLIKKDAIDVIALGNGTASRESENFLAKTLSEAGLKIPVVVVNEAGASVYSASALAEKEFPDLTVEKRSAASLARRLLDPLSELVKIDPCAIGVGQYQHDMDKKKLSLALSGVVEDSVNEVGVYLNVASPSLLSYVSGIGPTLAEGIVKYRNEHGAFKERKDLLQVPKLGPKAYTQCAGFLRISGGYPLDNTGVHPESYKAALELLKEVGLTLNDLGSQKSKDVLLGSLDLAALSVKLGVGEATLKDIVMDLSKPGRDPRDDVKQAELSIEARDIKDLKAGMILSGTVRNVMDFGAFVDIGVHQDGLVHISEMSSSFVKSPFEVVRIGEIVKVKVISIDLPRKRIGLSMKDIS